MALVIVSPPITEIEGVSGGNVWRYDRSGQHVYPYIHQVNKQPSDLQQKRRNAFRQCINYWNTQITATHIQQWQLYADHHPVTNRKGETVILTAYQMFMHINLYRAYTGVSLIASPPTD